MGSERDSPFLGNSVPDEFCGRLRRGGGCKNPSEFHVIWGRYASTSCSECKAYLIQRGYHYDDIHEITPECISPLSLWFPEESACRKPTSPEDWLQGRIVLG